MPTITRFEATPNSRLLHLLLSVAKSKCPYVNIQALISDISNHEKYQIMQYTRSFMKQLGNDVEPYNLERNLFLDVTSIYSKESNKHFIVAAMCVFMMLYANWTEHKTPEQLENVQREINQKVRNIISTTFYCNEPVSVYLRHIYRVDFKELQCEDIARFVYSLNSNLLSQELISADKKEKMVEIFEHSTKIKLPSCSSIAIEKSDFSYFEQEEKCFISFLVTIVVLPILTDSHPKSVQIAIDMMRESFIEHSDIVTETLLYDKIF